MSSKTKSPTENNDNSEDTCDITDTELSDLEKTINRCIERSLKKFMQKAIQDLKKEMKKMFDSQLEEIESFKTELNDLKGEISVIKNEVHELKREKKLMQDDVKAAVINSNDVEQYGRRWLLRIHGVQTSANEDCLEKAATLFKDKLGVSVEKHDLEAAHRLRPRKDGRPPAMIVRFMRRDKRQLVLQERRKLKGSGCSITEDLTHLNIKLLNRVQNHEAISQAWTSNGKIYGIPSGTRTKIQFKLFESVEDSIKAALSDNENKRVLRPRSVVS